MAALAFLLPLKAAAQIDLPTVKAGFSAGFNYDLLRSPTDISFDYPMGFFGFNIPFGSNLSIRAIGGDAFDEIFDDTDLFRNGEAFKPEASASQNTNYTIKVDMPMLGGVGSFAYTQNFFLNYNTTLGNAAMDTSTVFSESGMDMNLVIKGGVSIPLQFAFGWETLTFGYAYRLNKDIVFALNLHRHLFSMDFRGRADIDLLGNLDASIDAGPLGDGEMTINYLLDFPAEVANGSVNGKFTAAAWTPSIGVKLGRLSLASRFGLNTKVNGSIRGQFRLPDIVDLETGKTIFDDLDDMSVEDALELIDRITNVSADSIVYESTESMRWKLPQGHTVSLEVIRDVFSLSYTKTFGDIELKLRNIERTNKKTDDSDLPDSLNVDLGFTVDHIMMANINLFRTVFLNVGVFAFDVRSEDKENILGGAVPSYLRLGKAAMLPVLSFGGTMGTKIKLHIEGDVLPLPAVRTGIFYYF